MWSREKSMGWTNSASAVHPLSCKMMDATMMTKAIVKGLYFCQSIIMIMALAFQLLGKKLTKTFLSPAGSLRHNRPIINSSVWRLIRLKNIYWIVLKAIIFFRTIKWHPAATMKTALLDVNQAGPLCYMEQCQSLRRKHVNCSSVCHVIQL